MAFKAGAIYGEAILDTKKWEAGIKKVGKSSLNVAKVATAAFVGAMTISIVKANEFQKAMSNVATVVDTSVVSTQDLTKELLQLDPALGNTTDLTNALYQSFSAGAETASEAMETTTAAATFAGAALTDTATAVDVLTTASNAYGKEVVSTTEASDIFFTTIKQGKITGEQLSSTIGKSIPLFASLNIPLEELGAGMAAMTKQGVNASESTTQLNAIVNSFLKPSAEMKEALEAQGIASGATLLESEGLSGALEFLETATGGSKDELSKLLPSIEAIRGTLALTGTGGEEFASILEEMGSSAGATEEAFAKQEKTFETLRNQMDQVSILAGNIGKFFVDKIAVGAITAGAAMRDFLMSSSGMEIIASIAEKVAGTFEFLKGVFSLLIDNIFPPFQEIIGTIAEKIALFGSGAETGAGATKLLVGAVEFLSAGFSIAAQVVNSVIGTIGDLVFAVTESAAAVGSFFDMLTGKVSFSEVKENFKDVGSAFVNLGKGVITGWGDIIGEAVGQFTGFSAAVESGTIEIVTNVQSTSAAAKDFILSNFDAMLTGQTNFLGDYLALQDDVKQATEETVEIIADENLGLIATLKKAWGDHFAEAKFSWAGLADIITSTIGSALGSVSAISDQFFANEEAKQQLSYNRQLDALQEKFDNDLITQDEFDEQKKALDDAALVESNALAKKQFDTQKALRISDVIMDTASSIAGWWAAAPALGPIAGPVFAGVMTGASLGMGIAQGALIAGEQFVPARQFGGMASGRTRINEQGGEIVTLPDGSQVIPNDISRQIAGSSGGGGPTINFYDTIIRDDVDIDQMAEMISRKLGRRSRVA